MRIYLFIFLINPSDKKLCIKFMYTANNFSKKVLGVLKVRREVDYLDSPLFLKTEKTTIEEGGRG